MNVFLIKIIERGHNLSPFYRRACRKQKSTTRIIQNFKRNNNSISVINIKLQKNNKKATCSKQVYPQETYRFFWQINAPSTPSLDQLDP